MFTVIDEESKINPFAKQPNTLNVHSSQIRGKIEFRDVWFRYPTRKDQWILRGINFTIQANETVGLVGESGSGKSTITQLIYRFYDPQFG